MKQFLLFIISMASNMLFAQYSLNASNAPKAGSINTEAIDTLTQLSRGEAGPNKLYDFRAFNYHQESTTEYADPNTSNFANDFPEANLSRSAFGLGTAFIVSNASGIEWIGFAIEEDGAVPAGSQRLSNPETFFKYPSTYQNNYSDQSALRYAVPYDTLIGTFDIDSIIISYSAKKQVSYDGFGTLITPIANYNNVLRERNYSIVSIKLEACVKFLPFLPCNNVDLSTIIPNLNPEPDTSIVYSWYGAASPFALARISYNADDATIRNSGLNTDPSLTAISNSNVENILLSPNPTNGQDLYLPIKDLVTVEVVDLLGREQDCQVQRQFLATSQLSNGSYLIKMMSKDAYYTAKIVVHH